MLQRASPRAYTPPPQGPRSAEVPGAWAAWVGRMSDGGPTDGRIPLPMKEQVLVPTAPQGPRWKGNSSATCPVLRPPLRADPVSDP